MYFRNDYNQVFKKYGVSDQYFQIIEGYRTEKKGQNIIYCEYRHSHLGENICQ